MTLCSTPTTRVSHFSKNFEFHLPNPGSHSILYLKEKSQFSEISDSVYYSKISQQNGSDPFEREKKNVRIIGFMVFKSRARTHGVCTEFQDINKKCPNLAFQTKPAKFDTFVLWPRCILFKIDC